MDYIAMPSFVIIFSAVLVSSCGQTDRQKHIQRIILHESCKEAAKHLTPYSRTVVGVSRPNYNKP